MAIRTGIEGKDQGKIILGHGHPLLLRRDLERPIVQRDHHNALIVARYVQEIWKGKHLPRSPYIQVILVLANVHTRETQIRMVYIHLVCRIGEVTPIADLPSTYGMSASVPCRDEGMGEACVPGSAATRFPRAEYFLADVANDRMFLADDLGASLASVCVVYTCLESGPSGFFANRTFPVVLVA